MRLKEMGVKFKIIVDKPGDSTINYYAKVDKFKISSNEIAKIPKFIEKLNTYSSEYVKAKSSSNEANKVQNAAEQFKMNTPVTYTDKNGIKYTYNPELFKEPQVQSRFVTNSGAKKTTNKFPKFEIASKGNSTFETKPKLEKPTKKEKATNDLSCKIKENPDINQIKNFLEKPIGLVMAQN